MSDADLGRGPVSSRRRFSVEWGALTHKGLVRVTNEDCFFVGRFDRMLQPVLTNLPDSTSRSWHYEAGYAVVIADGMGGEVAGEIASHTAVSTPTATPPAITSTITRLRKFRQLRAVISSSDS